MDSPATNTSNQIRIKGNLAGHLCRTKNSVAKRSLTSSHLIESSVVLRALVTISPVFSQNFLNLEMDLQFLQSIPDDRAAAVLTPDTDYSSPFNQASEAYKYGEDLFNDYQQYLICYHLQEVQTWMDEDISAGIVDEYLCELNQRDSQVPTSQSDNINHPPTSALTPPTYSREEKQSTWSPFPINTKDEFEAIEEILAKDEEKRERFVSLH